MKLTITIAEPAQASSLYGFADQRSRPQLLPSDEELAELEKARKLEEAKKAAPVKTKADKDAEAVEEEDDSSEDEGEEDEEGEDSSEEDSSEEDEGEEAEEDEGEEAEEDEGEEDEGEEGGEEGGEEVAEASTYAIGRYANKSLKQGIVISGFHGVGKSVFTSLAKAHGVTISDSDSYKFTKDNFPQNYIDHILRMRKERDIVLVSSHKEVRDAMDALGIEYTLVIPEPSLKPIYMQNYADRNSPPEFLSFMNNEWYNLLDTCLPSPMSTTIELKEGQYLADIIADLL
jgi:hypothetical protein